ncbi:hypothetical protein Rhal01_01161 [Rubritalea halochordaticola]|uniref:PNPLA domain-containing protein n=1 Tax=Rubritalea halochordaticola TaxID=714537 RepID=A0ABP9V2Y1_9BACT
MKNSEPKNLLALDGGGIRGVFTIEVLRGIESQLREFHGRPEMVLSDHFHYVGGTSTGAIIGTLVSWGLTVDEISRLYVEQSPIMFKRQKWSQRLQSKFVETGLSDFFKTIFVEDDGQLAKLGTEKLKTFLLVVTRNAKTGSAWPITNNPNAKFNDKSQPGCNLDLPLWQLVRASTAAPTYFPPEVVTIYGEESDYREGVECAFEDGGVTPYNNPAYLLFLKATMPEYRMCWESGIDKMNLISIGTGTVPTGRDSMKSSLLDTARRLPESLIVSFQKYQDMLCRNHGACLFGPALDGEVGDMVRQSESADFNYSRYDYHYSTADLEYVKSISKRGLQLDNLDLIEYLQNLGAKYARENVKLNHIIPQSVSAQGDRKDGTVATS